MKLILESTDKLVNLQIDGATVPARVWQGETGLGIPVHAFITRVAVRSDQDATEFARDLEEHATPRPDVAGIPPRLIL